jgi:hypothetical protein
MYPNNPSELPQENGYPISPTSSAEQWPSGNEQTLPSELPEPTSEVSTGEAGDELRRGVVSQSENPSVPALDNPESHSVASEAMSEETAHPPADLLDGALANPSDQRLGDLAASVWQQPE